MRASERENLGHDRGALDRVAQKRDGLEPGQESSRPSTHASAHRKEIHRLKQLLAENTLQWIFAQAPRKIEADASAAPALARWHPPPDPRSDVIAEGSLSIERMCQMVPVQPPVFTGR